MGAWNKSRWNSVYYDTTNKRIVITQPITVKKLCSQTMEQFEEMEYMTYAIPMIALTDHYIELINGWHIDDVSKSMIREGSLKELGKLYIYAIEVI